MPSRASAGSRGWVIPVENAVGTMIVPRFSFDDTEPLYSPAGAETREVSETLPPSLLAVFFFFHLPVDNQGLQHWIRTGIKEVSLRPVVAFAGIV